MHDKKVNENAHWVVSLGYVMRAGRDALRGVQVRYGELLGNGSSGAKLSTSVGTAKY